MEVFDNSASRVLDVGDWVNYNYVCFPVNVKDWHWTLAVFRVEDGATIYYMDSLQESKEDVVLSIPPLLFEKLSIFGKSGCIKQFNPIIQAIQVPRQRKATMTAQCV